VGPAPERESATLDPLQHLSLTHTRLDVWVAVEIHERDGRNMATADLAEDSRDTGRPTTTVGTPMDGIAVKRRFQALLAARRHRTHLLGPTRGHISTAGATRSSGTRVGMRPARKTWNVP